MQRARCASFLHEVVRNASVVPASVAFVVILLSPHRTARHSFQLCFRVHYGWGVQDPTVRCVAPLSLTTVGIVMGSDGLVQIWDWTLGLHLRTLRRSSSLVGLSNRCPVFATSDGRVTLAMRSAVVRGFADDWDNAEERKHRNILLAAGDAIVTAEEGQLTVWRGQDQVVVSVPGLRTLEATCIIVGSRLIVGMDSESVIIEASQEPQEPMTEEQGR